MSNLNLSLRDALGWVSSGRYIRKVIYPKLETLVRDNVISPQERTKIAQKVRQEGSQILLPPLQLMDVVTLNTVQVNGFIAKSSLRLTDKITLDNVIKQSASRKEYKLAVKNQKEIKKSLEASPFVNSVPAVDYTNWWQKLIVFPNVSGQTLKQKLQSQTEQERVNTLKGIVQDYALLFNEINTPSNGCRPKITTEHMSFLDFFSMKYLDNQGEGNEAYELYRKYINPVLSSRPKKIIHGDYHAKNIIVNGITSVFDWPNAVNNGFPEFDLGTLLTKADISFEAEDEIIREYAFQNYALKNEQDLSYITYQFNQITQELVGSKRYWERSKKAKSKKKQVELRAYANVLANTALRRIKKNIKEENLPEEFLGPMFWDGFFVDDKSYQVESPVRELTDDCFVKLKEEFNPHKLMSQENLSETTPLVDSEDDPEPDLKSIRKTIAVDFYLRPLKVFTLSALTLGLAIVGTTVYKSFEEKIIQTEMQAQIDANKDFIVKQALRDDYTSSFRLAFTNVFSKYYDNKITSLPIDSPSIDSVASKYSLNPSLLRNILTTNKVCASYLMRHYKDGVDFPGLNILDPFLIAGQFEDQEVLDMHENLELGAKRLSALMKKHKNESNAEFMALLDFYYPFQTKDGKLSWTWGWGDYAGKMSYVNDLVWSMAITAKKGVTYIHDKFSTGVSLNYVLAPSDFDFSPFIEDVTTYHVDSLPKLKIFTPID